MKKYMNSFKQSAGYSEGAIESGDHSKTGAPLSRICNSARNISGFAIRKLIPESKYDSPDHLNGDNLAKRSRRRQLQIASCSERHYKCRSTGLTVELQLSELISPQVNAAQRCGRQFPLILSAASQPDRLSTVTCGTRPDRVDRPVGVNKNNNNK
jgi:hypothetical protein